jgi:hypothetical protein
VRVFSASIVVKMKGDNSLLQIVVAPKSILGYSGVILGFWASSNKNFLLSQLWLLCGYGSTTIPYTVGVVQFLTWDWIVSRKTDQQHGLPRNTQGESRSSGCWISRPVPRYSLELLDPCYKTSRARSLFLLGQPHVLQRYAPKTASSVSGQEVC